MIIDVEGTKQSSHLEKISSHYCPASNGFKHSGSYILLLFYKSKVSSQGSASPVPAARIATVPRLERQGCVHYARDNLIGRPQRPLVVQTQYNTCSDVQYM